MTKTIRNVISKISSQIMNRTNPSRHNLQVPISISFAPETNTGRLIVNRESLIIKGETKDLSTNGISFIVDSIRLREHYLVGENRTLNAELDLPAGRIAMQVIGQRYEQVGEHLSVCKYLIGATIVNMTALERDIYEEYLKYGNKGKKQLKSVFSYDTTKG